MLCIIIIMNLRERENKKGLGDWQEENELRILKQTGKKKSRTSK